VLFALPVALCTYPPMQDWAAHLRIVELWRSAGDASAGMLGADHATRSWLQPYVGHHLILRGLGALFPLPLAQRLMLVLYALALPLSFLYLLRVAGRDRRYALLSFAFVYNAPLIYGLFPQALSLPLVLAGLALLKRTLDAPTLRREIVLSVVTLAIFLFHFSAFFTFGLAAATIFFAHVWRPQEILRRALFTLPALALALVWVLSTIESEGFVPIWWPLDTNIANFRLGLIEVLHGWVDELALLLVLLTAFLCALLPAKKDDPPRRPRDWSFGVAGLVLLVAVFCLPAETKKPAEIWSPNLRLALPAVLLLLTVPRATLGRLRALVFVPLMLGLVLLGATLTSTFSAFDRQARHVETVLAKVPRDRTLLPIIYDAKDGVHQGLPLLHLPELYQLGGGGFVGRELVGGPAAPVKITRPYGAPAWYLPLTFNYQLHGAYDYFLVLWPELPHPPRTFVGAGSNVRLVAHAGRFCLYENVGPRRPKRAASARPGQAAWRPDAESGSVRRW
jgi:hypothetical protein